MESGKRYRCWGWEQKQYAGERMKSCSPEQLAKKLGIHKRQLYEWREQFLYLAVVLDAYSRRVVGWALDESLETSLVGGSTTQGDHGTQARDRLGASFRSGHAVRLAGEYQPAGAVPYRAGHESRRPPTTMPCARISSKPSSKRKSIIAGNRDRADLELHMADFLEQYYNRRRLHSALGYRSPGSSSRVCRCQRRRLSFFRHEEIYQSRCRYQTGRNQEPLPAHRSDEFPAEYSLASCSPAELASASSSFVMLATNNPVSSS